MNCLLFFVCECVFVVEVFDVEVFVVECERGFDVRCGFEKFESALL